MITTIWWHTVNICVRLRLPTATNRLMDAFVVGRMQTKHVNNHWVTKMKQTCWLVVSRGTLFMCVCVCTSVCVLIQCVYGFVHVSASLCVWLIFCNLMEAPLDPPPHQFVIGLWHQHQGLDHVSPLYVPLPLSSLFSLSFSTHHMICYITGLRSELD